MITVEKILFLRNVPLFSGLPPEELGALAGIAEEVVYSTDQPIIEEGAMGDTMFLIVEGEVDVHRGDDSLAVLKSQDYFGEMTILDGEPRSASVTARQDCLLLRINQSDFQAILRRHANVALSIIRTLTRRLRETDSGVSQNSDEETE
jgi:CRP-like cAMP-binding protein